MLDPTADLGRGTADLIRRQGNSDHGDSPLANQSRNAAGTGFDRDQRIFA
jgi:hypothetical protein